MSSESRFQGIQGRVGSDPKKTRLHWSVFTPLVFAPTIPLVRVLLTRRNFSHQTVSRVTLGLIGVALVHGVTVMSSLDSFS